MSPPHAPPSTARLARCARGLGPIATMELRHVGALARGQTPTTLRQRSHDLLFLPAARSTATTRECRTLEESFACPGFGRFKVSAAQLDRVAAACGRERPIRIATTVEGKRFDRRDFGRFVGRELAARGVKVTERGGPRLLVFAVDDAFYFGLRDGVWSDASGRKAAGDREAAAPPDVAAAMAFLLKPEAGERVADLCCGTGTLLAEFRAYAPDAALHGRDIDRAALTIARRRFKGAAHVDLKIGDGTATDVAPGGVTAFVINPPFGAQMGDSAANPALYTGLIAEMRRLGASDGWRAAILTGDLPALDAALLAHRGGVVEQRRVALQLRGLDAVIAVLAGGVF
ncbi:MAG: methyltransferase [Pseudomonadota bacterium]